MKHPFSVFPVCFAILASTLWSEAQPVRTDHVTAELVSEYAGLVPGKSNTVALRLEMEDGWHTYWKHAGDTGLPTQIEWTLPEGITAGFIQWPAPEWFEYFGMVSYAYSEEVFHLIDLTVAENFAPGERVTLKATADWLACKEACIPGSADLTLELPIDSSPEASAWKAQFEDTRKQLPQALAGWEMKVVDNGESFALTIAGPPGANLENREITYFASDGWVAASQPRTALAEGRLMTQVLPKSEFEPETDRDRFRGVLVSDSPWNADEPFVALAVDLSFSTNDTVAKWAAQLAGDSGEVSGAFSESSEAARPSFLTALLFALVGGMLLNLMPCVFPVLSIKVLGFVQQAGDDKLKIKFHGLVFTLGVLASFWVLAGLFLVLRAAGQEIGWGFQLQSPGFVAVLASVLFLFGLNLSGVFEIGESLTGAGSQLQAKSGYSGSFFSGVLATVVATPCTAPFMGSALGIIATLSSAKSMLLFTFLALGVAAPYLVLSFFPAFLKLLPRPGAWMESFKKGLAFLLYATVVWLAWVFGNQVGVSGMAKLLLGLVFLGAAAWIWGNWGSLTRKKHVRLLALAVALPVLMVGGWFQYRGSLDVAPELTSESQGSSGINWRPYAPDTVQALVAEGKTVYVDFTATWCLTCQVNKKVAFGNNEVVEFFKSNDIAALKGDWTRRDPVITRELQKFGRNGVPTNVIYRPDGSTTLLPEVLTPGIVLDALKGV